jgi:hypothetical protein
MSGGSWRGGWSPVSGALRCKQCRLRGCSERFADRVTRDAVRQACAIGVELDSTPADACEKPMDLPSGEVWIFAVWEMADARKGREV